MGTDLPETKVEKSAVKCLVTVTTKGPGKVSLGLVCVVVQGVDDDRSIEPGLGR